MNKTSFSFLGAKFRRPVKLRRMVYRAAGNDYVDTAKIAERPSASSIL
ncbi:MAG TPA: hypothetical protein VIX19_19785 [Terriglobales bacterium]